MSHTSVLIVEDSPLAARLISAVLGSDPTLQVVGIAPDGLEAIRMTQTCKPNVIIMDIHLPRMDGLEAIRRIMASTPTPILTLTSFLSRQGRDNVFNAMTYGAVDLMEKSLFDGSRVDPRVQAELIARVKALATMRVVHHPSTHSAARPSVIPPGHEGIPATASNKIVGVVASAGGPQALQVILADLPKAFPAPLVIVQHITPGFVDGLVEWLDHGTDVAITKAREGEVLEPGRGYLAPEGLHLRVTPVGRLALSEEPPVDGARPSGTVLLRSIAEVYGARAMGVVLTGMGRDGAAGLLALRHQKGHTVVQEESGCVASWMPRAAIATGAAEAVVPLREMAARIVQWVMKGA